MGYRILADATMAVHFAFLVYVALGGFLAWWRPRLLWPHLIAGLWGILILTTGIQCPLTHLENWARENSGGERLPASGFIDHYIEGTIYPEAYTPLLQLLTVAAILTSWIVPLRRRIARRRERHDPPNDVSPDLRTGRG